MAIRNVTIDSATSSAGGSTNPLTWNHTCSGDNRCLVVAVGTNGNPALEATYNSVAMTKVGSAQEGVSGYRVSLWVLTNPTTGANQIRVSLSAAAAYSVRSLSFTEVHQANPHGNAHVTTIDAATTISLAVSSTAGDVVVDALVWNQNALPSSVSAVGAQQTILGGAAIGAFVRTICSSESGSATTTMSWNLTSATNMVVCGLSLHPVSVDARTLAMMGVGH